MNFNQVSFFRLYNQQVSASRFNSAGKLVQWMGAMQAQDLNMAKWGVGLRLTGSTEQAINGAIDNAEIVRTHMLRPTWHLVSQQDVYWMLELTAPHIKASVKSRNKELGLTELVIEKSGILIRELLTGGKTLTRPELITELEAAGIATGGLRAAHIMLEAELAGLVCNGPAKGKQQTYALLSEWVPVAKRLSYDKALGELARRYFNSHAPATLQDFIWWSGLPATAARQALEMIKNDFTAEIISGQTYFLPLSFNIPDMSAGSVHLLPAFDEFIISYKTRNISLASVNQNKVLTVNGIFWPVIVTGGQVAGTWSREIKKETVIVRTSYFKPPARRTVRNVEKAADDFAGFLNLKLKMIPA